MFEELDTVELTHDIKKPGLKNGDLGAIVNVYNKGEAYEVEFVAPNGRTIALLTLMPDDMRLHESKDEHASLWFNTPISLSTASGMAFAVSSRENIWRDFDTLISNDELRIKTETPESEVNTEEFRYPATL